MTALSVDIGVIHFVGIGGVGMSGIAEVMHNLGYQVQGSDISENTNVKRLRGLGVPVEVRHHEDNIKNANAVVVSSAVQTDNPELVASRAYGIPVVRRAEMLAELMRLKSSVAIAGTHGKTTTTALVAAILDAAGFDPTMINGGIVNAYGATGRLGAGGWIVVEADESDGTFMRLPATVAVVTNLDPEHLDHYGDFNALKESFHIFLENIPFYGFAVLCIDHPDVQALAGRIRDRRVITYGMNTQADVRTSSMHYEKNGVVFDVTLTGKRDSAEQTLKDFYLPMPGRHNMLNALAAIAVSLNLGVDSNVIRQGLSNFSGIHRRFTLVDTWNGVRIYDDYGHHPAEISVVLKAAREMTKGRLVAVVQPHRYSRLQALFDDFCVSLSEADRVIVTPVYAAGEAPQEGITHEALASSLMARGHRGASVLDNHEDLASALADYLQSDDTVVCLGAGNITDWAHALPAALETFFCQAGRVA
ncbi:MAG: UDP-N-acetylmuramate--L-alanine ligase [Parvularculales bacterium]